MRRLAQQIVLTFIAILVVFVANQTFAQTELGGTLSSPAAGKVAREETYETGRGIGLGSGSRANAAQTSAIAYNPAGLATTRSYQIESQAGYVPSSKTWYLGGAVADSTNQIAAGFAFRYIFGDGDRDYDGWDGKLALALPLTQAISIGVSGRYLSIESNKKNANGERVGPEGKGFTMDASIRMTLAESFHIAILGYNFIDMESSLAPMMFGGSAAFSLSTEFSIGGDFLVDVNSFDSTEYVGGGGIEYLVSGTFPIRAGYRHETGRSLHQISGSIGYVDPFYSAEFSVRQDVSGNDKETVLMAGFRYHVQ